MTEPSDPALPDSSAWRPPLILKVIAVAVVAAILAGVTLWKGEPP